MTKYIVKNCPAYIINGHCVLNGERDSLFDEVLCQDRTDCPIKQLIWFVKLDNAVCDYVKGRIPVINNKVLQILQVEDVE